MNLTSKPKILLFVDWFLPGYKAGGPIRSCANLISHLRDDFAFYVITRDTDYCETTPYETVKSDRWNTLEEYLHVYYASSGSLSIKCIKRLIKETEFDLVHLNGIYSFYFSILPAFLLRNSDVPVVVSARGMLAQSAVDVKKRKKGVFLKFAKYAGLFRGALFHATSKQEKEEIKEYFGNEKLIHIAPNLPKRLNGKEWRPRAKKQDELKLISVARIAPEKNTLYALEILQGLDLTGKLAFDLYGPVYNEKYWSDCRAVIREMPDNIAVNWHGSIPSGEVHEVLQKSHLLFMPTRGENFGHIILESFLAGCPVLISDQTPWGRLEQKKSGWDLSLQNRKGFREKLKVCLAMNPDAYQELSEGAYRYGKSIAKDERSVEQAKKLYETALKQFRSIADS